ncbi:MAG: FAD-dependent oxidoreductase [Clostridia bacterium]|nr:FAD-dependent oxidoreductase [Clostridia bacterium]
MKKKIAIIGAGIAGLAAGCYGQMNGYETEIFEMHCIPGGLCTAWERKGYTFDGCIHWLMGANPDSMFYESWKEVGALEGKEFVNHEYIVQIENPSGEKLILYTDIHQLEKHLLELSPTDERIIKELADAVRKFKDIRLASKDPDLMKYFGITVGDFVQRFNSSFLREALLSFAPREYKAFSLIFQLAVYNNRDACWPVGGSLEFARRIEKRYLELGGKIQYQAKVEEIIIKDHRAMGIKLADGTTCESDFVISAIDGYTTIFRILKGKYIDDEIQTLYKNSKTSKTSIQISLGIDCDLSDQPYFVNTLLETPLRIGNNECNQVLIRNYCYDKTLCPSGKSVVTTLIYTDFEYWNELYKDQKAYGLEKKKAAKQFIEIFEKRFPKAKGKIEVIDVATPVTYARYTNVWQGSYCGWMFPAGKIPTTLPGFAGFYMAGQWTQPTGGLPTALMTGKGSIMRVCMEDGKAFRTCME